MRLTRLLLEPVLGDRAFLCQAEETDAGQMDSKWSSVEESIADSRVCGLESPM